MSNPSSDSYRNPLRHTGQDYSFAPRYIRNRDPHSPIDASTDIKPKENQGYYPTGSFWTNSTNGNLFALQKITNNLANWILLSSGVVGPLLSITGDDSVVVTPTLAGTINLQGLVVANATHAKAIFTESPSANTEKIDVQVTAAIAATDITKVGLAAFNNAQFTVDANGFVSITNFSTTQYVNVTHSGGAHPSPYTVSATDEYISCDTTSAVAGTISILLPNAPTTLREFIIKDRTGGCSTNNISITTVGGAVTIDGATTYTLNSNYASVQLIFNGTSYEVY